MMLQARRRKTRPRARLALSRFERGQSRGCLRWRFTRAYLWRFVFVDGNSRREWPGYLDRVRDVDRQDVSVFSSPRLCSQWPPEKPKLGALIPVIDAILEADKMAPPKQRHTAKRIFERLREEYRGFSGGYTVVKDHVRLARTRNRETFVPPSHPPGHTQVETLVRALG